MAKLQEGDRVKIVTRPVTEQDRKVTKYFPHMAGLTGVIANYYNDREVAVKIDIESLGPIPKRVHSDATARMRAGFVEELSEEAKKMFTKEEFDFVPNYVLLVEAADLEKV